jgi:Domain of unknown function (DUF3783)
MEGKARILVFGFAAEEQLRIDEGLAAIGLPAPLRLGPGQASQTLRSILEDGRSASEDRSGFAPPEPTVLFHNVSDGGVQALMRFFRQASRRRPIFAVVTPTSIEWTLAELLGHLHAERAALEGRG